MIDFVAYYTMLVKLGKITIDRVPLKYRDAVRQKVQQEGE